MSEDPADSHNIVRMVELLTWRNHQLVVFELLNCDLYQHIQENNYQGFPVDTIRSYTKQIL